MHGDFDKPNKVKTTKETVPPEMSGEVLGGSESIEAEKTFIPEAPDLRIEAIEEGIRLTEIGRGSAQADLERWRKNPTTEAYHFAYYLPEIKNRLARAEQSITSSRLDIDLIKAHASSPEESDTVIRNFVGNQILSSKTASLRKELSRLNQGTTSSEVDREMIQRGIDSLLLMGVTDEELPKGIQEDPDFEACLAQADTHASEESEKDARARGYKPETTAIKIFRDRFPQKSVYYERITKSNEATMGLIDVKDSVKSEQATIITIESNPENFSRIDDPLLSNEQGSEGQDEKEVTSVSPERVDLENMTPEALREFREKQPYSERLAEYITGLRFDDYQLVERLQKDQEIIRQKYNLPNIKILSSDPREYERELKNMASKLGVEIRTEAEVGQFFVEHSYAAGVHIEDESIVALDIKNDNLQSYRQSLLVLEHELVHANQHSRYPSMPIEAMEYEAYISSANLSHLITMDIKERAESLDAFFGMFIGGSVGHWYGTKAVERGLSKNPIWNNADYFLPEKQTAEIEESERIKLPKSITTSKGSVYTYLEDGRTQRYKQATETLESPMDLLVFIPPWKQIEDKAKELYPSIFNGIENEAQFEQLMLEYMDKGGQKTIRPAIGIKETYSLVDVDSDEPVFLNFVDKQNNRVDFLLPTSRKPKIGYSTFDARKYIDEKTGESMKERHIGNKIVTIAY